MRHAYKNFTQITGISETRRFPRLGKIRLGIKAKTAQGKEYPKDVDYFVVPDEVAAVYGDKPKVLEIVFPVEDLTFIFPQAYKSYGNGVLKCKGNGVEAIRLDDKGNPVEVQCPCPALDDGKKTCHQVANLSFLLPKVSMAGVYQIDTGSIHNIININSALDYARGMLGKIAWITFRLERVPQIVTYQGKKSTKALLQLRFDGAIENIRRIRGGQEDNLALLSAPSTPPANGNSSAAQSLDEPTAEDDDVDLEGMNEEIPPAAPPPSEADPVGQELPFESDEPPLRGEAEMTAQQLNAIDSLLAAIGANDQRVKEIQIMINGRMTQKQAAELIVNLQAEKKGRKK